LTSRQKDEGEGEKGKGKGIEGLFQNEYPSGGRQKNSGKNDKLDHRRKDKFTLKTSISSFVEQGGRKGLEKGGEGRKS